MRSQLIVLTILSIALTSCANRRYRHDSYFGADRDHMIYKPSKQRFSRHSYACLEASVSAKAFVKTLQGKMGEENWKIQIEGLQSHFAPLLNRYAERRYQGDPYGQQLQMKVELIKFRPCRPGMDVLEFFGTLGNGNGRASWGKAYYLFKFISNGREVAQFQSVAMIPGNNSVAWESAAIALFENFKDFMSEDDDVEP